VATLHSNRESPFIRACALFSLDLTFVERTLNEVSPQRWAEFFGGGQRGGRAASFLAIQLARKRCREGDHAEEARLGLAAATIVITDEAPAYRDAWVCALSGIEHQLEAVSDPSDLGARLHELALAALDDLNVRFARPGLDPPSQRRELDSIVHFLLVAEQALRLPLSDISADLERRMRNRSARRRVKPPDTFFHKHRDGIVRLWKEQREPWFRERYTLITGKSSPAEFMMKNQAAKTGQIRNEVSRVFSPEDHRDFRAEMEALYRKQQGLPAKGEGWVSQTFLVRCVQDVLKGYEVIQEARLAWLGQQRLDIFVPALNLAIEYQGEQHYFPLEHWGGEQGLRDRKNMDNTKREACKKAGVCLIEWHYSDQISTDSVKARLINLGIKF
jgi:hypothetical protein